MPEETVSPWLQITTFVRKGPRYLWEYARWRARREWARRLEGPGRWPDPGDGAAAPRGPRLHDPARLPAIVAAVPEELRRSTIDRARAIVEGRFRYRGCEVRFPGEVDWSHCPEGNRDWTWDLNRHSSFPLLGRAYAYTGDAALLRRFGELLRDWMEKNPPRVDALAWRPFEVGVRIAHWCWAHALFAPSAELDEESRAALLRGLLGMGRFLASHVERHAWNNHLLLEAKSLAMLGLLHPELPGAASWASQGLRLLARQVRRQVRADGTHSEQSSMYHEIIASELLEQIVVLRLASAGETQRVASLLLGALRRMTAFLAALRRSDGSLPLLGDALDDVDHVRFDAVSGLDALEGDGAVVRGPHAEATAWLLAAVGKTPRADPEPHGGAPGSRAFSDGGYCVLRCDRPDPSLHMVLDCGPFGDPIVPGHGHADALSLDVSVGDCPVVVDPGMYSAHLGKRWRNYFRGTAAHSTLLVDGRDQSILSGLRRVARPANARLLEWWSVPFVDLAVAEHDGYRRLPGGVFHRRIVVFLKPRSWVILDAVRGRGAHRLELLFHLHPALDVQLLSDGVSAIARDDRGVGMAFLPTDPAAWESRVARGEGEGELVAGPIQGWVGFRSATKEPASVLVYRRDDAPPLAWTTCLVPLTAAEAAPPRVEAVGVLAEEGGFEAEAYQAAEIASPEGSRDIVLARVHDLREGPRTPGVLRARGLARDGRLVTIAVSPAGAILSGALAGGSVLRWKGSDVLRATGTGPPVAAAFRVSGETLEIHGASAGGRALELRVPPVQRVTWNGRDLPFERRGDGIRVEVP